MATTKLGTTKSASRAINYAEKRAIEKSGHNLDIDYAKSHMKMTRSMFGKEDGIQAHTVIQSFKPQETTPEKANEIGLELAQKIAPDHQVAVYTHDDTNHIHNHIVIGSINMETGKKYQSNAKQRNFVKEQNDTICRNHGLSVVQERTNPVRYTLAEQELRKKEKRSWKDEIRRAIDITKDKSTDLDSLKSHLKQDFGIETKLRGRTLSFKHPEQERFVRANKLGYDFEKGALEHEFRREASREGTWQEFERTIEQSRPAPRTKDEERTISERPADGKNESVERGNGKDTDYLEWASQQIRERDAKSAESKRRKDKERDIEIER